MPHPTRTSWSLAIGLGAAWLLAGCTRTLVLDEDSGAPGAAICVPGRTDGFALPSPRWALASAHAARRMQDASDLDIGLDAAWFLASGWQVSGFACAEYGAPWSPSPRWQGDEGCLELDRGTHHAELVKLYPRLYGPPARYEGLVAGDQPEVAALSLAASVVASHALWGRAEVQVAPADWYDNAGDARAPEAISALLHAEGPWSGSLPDLLEDCGDDVLACLEGDAAARVGGVLDKQERLRSADCYDAPLAERTVREHARAVAALWGESAGPAEAAAVAALTGEGFATEAPAVLDALDAHFITRLDCPEQSLWEVYRFSCP